MEKVLREPTQKDAVFDLLLVNRENLMSKVEIGAILATAITKPLSLKISVDSRKVLAKLQPWTQGEQTSGCSVN